MANQNTKSRCEGMVSDAIDKINECKREVRQNFEDMDFANASTRDDFEEIIESMEADFQNLINTISSYSFK